MVSWSFFALLSCTHTSVNFFFLLILFSFIFVLANSSLNLPFAISNPQYFPILLPSYAFTLPLLTGVDSHSFPSHSPISSSFLFVPLFSPTNIRLCNQCLIYSLYVLSFILSNLSIPFPSSYPSGADFHPSQLLPNALYAPLYSPPVATSTPDELPSVTCPRRGRNVVITSYHIKTTTQTQLLCSNHQYCLLCLLNPRAPRRGTARRGIAQGREQQ